MNQIEYEEGDAPAVTTILVNWNGSHDTIECLESLFASDYPNQLVVVVDNGSKDNSLAKLVAWAQKCVKSYPDNDCNPIKIYATSDRPIRFVKLSLEQAASVGKWNSDADLFLIDAQRNHGFAGAVNIGIRFALMNRRVRYVWVLNNDTVVCTDCLSRMVKRLGDQDSAGMCGSRILFYWQPTKIQVLGGARFSPLKGTSRLIGHQLPASELVDTEKVERQLDHLSGASMLVSRRFIEEVGLMDEKYFLYYEEVDWIMRGKNRYSVVYEDNALVYHKEGASIGSSHNRSIRSPLSCFFLVKSRLRFTRIFFPWALPSVFTYSALVALRALLEGNRKQAYAMFSALRGLSAEEALGWTPE
jgi:GT2 family glycosyltransferase